MDAQGQFHPRNCSPSQRIRKMELEPQAKELFKETFPQIGSLDLRLGNLPIAPESILCEASISRARLASSSDSGKSPGVIRMLKITVNVVCWADVS